MNERRASAEADAALEATLLVDAGIGVEDPVECLDDLVVLFDMSVSLRRFRERVILRRRTVGRDCSARSRAVAPRSSAGPGSITTP